MIVLSPAEREYVVTLLIVFIVGIIGIYWALIEADKDDKGNDDDDATN